MKQFKFWSVVAAILVVAPVLCSAQPVIEFDKRSHDFGEKYPHQALVHQFTFKNVGNESLHIDRVTTNCGCTAAVLSATSVAAGATGIISVTMTTSYATGVMLKNATVLSNDPKNPRVKLEVKAKIKKMWVFSPRPSYTFQDVPFGTEKSLTLKLQNLEEEPFKILSTRVRKPEFKVDYGEGGADGIPITVTVKPQNKKGFVVDTLEIKTDNKKNPLVSVSITAKVVGHVRFSRERLWFGAVKSGETITRTLTVSLADELKDQQLDITEIEGDKDIISGTIKEKMPDGAWELEFVLKAPEKPGFRTGVMKIHTNLKSEPIAELPYSAIVRNTNSRENPLGLDDLKK